VIAVRASSEVIVVLGSAILIGLSFLAILAGIVFSLTVIGAVIGIPFIVVGVLGLIAGIVGGAAVSSSRSFSERALAIRITATECEGFSAGCVSGRPCQPIALPSPPRPTWRARLGAARIESENPRKSSCARKRADFRG
jgi:hypothetical protein